MNDFKRVLPGSLAAAAATCEGSSMGDSAEDIRRQMQDVRRSAAEEVRELVDTAKTLTDWRYHVKHHPWICAGTALALGFLIVPRKRHVQSEEAKELIALLKKYNVGVTAPGESTNKGMVKTMIGAAVPIVARAAVNLAQQRLATGGGLGSLLGGGRRRETPFEEFHTPR
jgi:ElaB/YqjD/DUF883 family membrane-anchored ribosome-binding protein